VAARHPLFTIGFTQTTAEHFFGRLREHGVDLLLDIRLHPDGQLAGFAKRADLPYFLRELADCDYRHLPELAPSQEIMDAYRSGKNWKQFLDAFGGLMSERNIPSALDESLFLRHRACLLCSEAKADRCHRSVAAQRALERWPQLEIIDL
jgi:uncharacterized protein (DUF488 family)